MMDDYHGNLLDYIDRLKLDHDRLLLKCAQLLLESQEKDRIIKQLMDICDSWYNEARACARGGFEHEVTRRNRNI
ncbi:hypothetical protein [Mahella australiensis]|uniref:Uncharacterized protein n=1 Tax=Mahella australiensis (strain DSM 15567 / CIP 107919 / 50-1 BON) TaxID=697281 RepID=F3ZVF8_MAHA5|nr:hypothetical protein [Mahella australiensis]AEE95308.1 hypothetical protein Mahau_0085 [Mahella australiensis 50-1 BON]